MSITPVYPLQCHGRHQRVLGDGDRGGLWVSCFSMLSFCPFLFGLVSPPLPAGCVWEQAAGVPGWGVCTWTSAVPCRAASGQAYTVLCHVIPHRPGSRLLLVMRRRRAGEDKNDEEDTQRKTIQEYLALTANEKQWLTEYIQPCTQSFN